ncbi:MAG: hypothetical protein AAFV43_04625 [Planctomycetota bacterium]
MNLPSGGAAARPRPGGGKLPGLAEKPSIDRDRIRQGIGTSPGRKPDMPDWFQPGATRPSERPNRPGGANPDRPNRPGGDLGRPGRPGAVDPDRPSRPGRPGLGPDRPNRPNRPGVRPPRPWYPNHPWHGNYRPGYWWRPATAVGLTGWVAYDWATPNYYTYGSGGSVYYENNNVYVDGQQYATGEEYYQQATTIVESAPVVEEEEAAEIEWMPLGVFALTAEGVNASSMYLQLAISKDAVIAGTFYNETTGVTHPVEGMVDEESQRAAWRAADGTNADIVMETGVYNLTQDEADALVHFGPDETQVWKLVRLDEADRPDDLPEAFDQETPE